MPERVADVPGPALATLTQDRFSHQGWIYERKLDGMRVIASRANGTVRLRSRTGGDAGASFPELVDALESTVAPDFVVDGEVVAFDGAQTSFARLQPRMHVSNAAKARRSGVPIVYYLFDLLHLDGHSTRGLPLRERKSLLLDLFDWDDPLRFTTHRNAEGLAYLEQACSRGWEGLIAKRADSVYQSGRTRDWLKFKCEQAQEFVVGGWTDPQGSRNGFGALLLGYYDEAGSLVYAGKVGTGFGASLLASLSEQLRALTRMSPAYAERTLPSAPVFRRGVHWVEPKLVTQVAFTEWTRDGQLRHPRFLGLRTDKPAAHVVREVGGA
ncbi:MAG: ATP-dependent DNA ligase [Nocardioidaceae bacterium]|nr:ATP-dependent DNA ligase [Nocardioidaceae bacterium]